MPDRREFYKGLMENLHWTPRQISEDITIPQMVGLWLKDEAEGWSTVGLGEALAWARKKEEEKAAAEKAHAGTS